MQAQLETAERGERPEKRAHVGSSSVWCPLTSMTALSNLQAGAAGVKVVVPPIGGVGAPSGFNGTDSVQAMNASTVYEIVTLLVRPECNGKGADCMRRARVR